MNLSDDGTYLARDEYIQALRKNEYPLLNGISNPLKIKCRLLTACRYYLCGPRWYDSISEIAD